MAVMVSDRRVRAAARAGWGRGVRLLVSGLLVLHLLAVLLPPFAFQTSPIRGLGSPAAEAAMSWLRPYIDALYLHHGYAFFAPDPGPSHLMVATLEFSDDRAPTELTLPDLQRHWPRLLYHRHFMLSEHLHSSFAPSQPPPDVENDPVQAQAWRAGRELYVKRKNAIEGYLRKRHGAQRVTLRRVEHRLVDPYEFLERGLAVDDPSTYIELPEDKLPDMTP